jgi:hypothetical protein
VTPQLIKHGAGDRVGRLFRVHASLCVAVVEVTGYDNEVCIRLCVVAAGLISGRK